MWIDFSSEKDLVPPDLEIKADIEEPSDFNRTFTKPTPVLYQLEEKQKKEEDNEQDEEDEEEEELKPRKSYDQFLAEYFENVASEGKKTVRCYVNLE